MTDQPTDHFAEPALEPEEPNKPSRRVPVIAGVSVLVAGVLAGGAFAASHILSGGAGPETVLPANAVAFVSVDLDPGAKQKIEAIRTLRKFPGLKDTIKIGEKGDVRERIFESAVGTGACKGKLDYSKDIEPWLGDKAAMGALDLGEDEPTPLLALEVSDQDAAAKGLDKIDQCAEDESASAHAYRDGFMLFSDTKDHLDKALAETKKGSLADDKAFADWTDKSGGDGIVSFYVSRQAADLIATMMPAELADQSGNLSDALADFKGMAGALRFADGGMELEMAAEGGQDYVGRGNLGEAITGLPDDTAVAMAFTVPDNFAKLMMSRIEDAFGGEADGLVAQAEAQTGLSFPEDLQTLLGDAVVLALGGDAPADLAATSGPADLPVGLKIIGNPDKIKAVIAKAEERAGQRLSDAGVVQEAGDGAYIAASNSKFAAELEKGGRLGDEPAFKKVVPGGGDSSFAIFVNFESAWRDSILTLVKQQVGQQAADEIKANIAPLEAFGISGWVDGKVSHAIVKLTTD